MRVFYAVTFDYATKEKLALIRDQVANHADKGRFTALENFHLTLEFIGEIPNDEMEDYASMLDTLTVFPEQLIISSVGKFTKKNKDILWLGIQRNEQLMKLSKQLRHALDEYGFSVENKKYKPHITIGRQVVMFEDLKDIVVEPLVMPVHSIALMESKRVHGRLVYEVLDEIEVGGLNE